MQVWSLSQKYPLEKEMMTHSNIFACEIPGTEEPGGLQSVRSQRVEQVTQRAHTYANIIGRDVIKPIR